jgi:hypothetical protein
MEYLDKKEMGKKIKADYNLFKALNRFYMQQVFTNLDGSVARVVIDACVTEVKTEDGGCAKIGHLSSGKGDNGFFVRLQSWDERDSADKQRHETFNGLVKQGKKLRITIEEI